MIEFYSEKEKKLKVLCVGSHPDDIEIGCGGTIIKWLDMNIIENIDWVIFSSNSIRRSEAKNSFSSFINNQASSSIIIEDYDDSFLPYYGKEIKEKFLEIKSKIANPDIIFTNYRKDFHQDHQFISNLTHNLFRDHLILEYEIPKYDPDLGNPNVFINLDNQIIKKKIDLILKHFPSQNHHHWFCEEKLSALNILRGIQSNNEKIYSESFYCSKIIIR